MCSLHPNFQPILIRQFSGFPFVKLAAIYWLINFISFSFSFLFIAEEDYDQFCLAYMFTYRDFEMGTLGLAWTGDLKNAGGVCEKNGVSFTEAI